MCLTVTMLQCIFRWVSTGGSASRERKTPSPPPLPSPGSTPSPQPSPRLLPGPGRVSPSFDSEIPVEANVYTAVTDTSVDKSYTQQNGSNPDNGPNHTSSNSSQQSSEPQISLEGSPSPSKEYHREKSSKSTFQTLKDMVVNIIRNGDETRQGKTSRRDRSSKDQKVVIQLYCAQKTDLTDFALQELKTKLSSELGEDGLKLDIRIRTIHSDIKDHMPLILICLCSSRLYADFSNAVSGIPIGSNTAVLMFHHLKQHALPTVPSNVLLTEADVKTVGIVIDVAFYERKGLYACDMNTSAYKTLRTFIKDH